MPRKKGWKTPDEIREKIQGSMLINRLQEHVQTDTLSPSQVNAANVLLKKVIPDLKQNDDTLVIDATSETMKSIIASIPKCPPKS